MKEQWIIGDSLKEPKLGFPKTPKNIAFAAGNAQDQAHANIVACDNEMRENYKINHEAIGQHIYPFLYSEFTPDGGRYTLLINESEWVSAKPVPRSYEIVKSVSHIPLGIWSIISRYAEYPKGGDWIEPLDHYHQTLTKALHSLEDLKLEKEVEKQLKSVLKKTSAFCEKCVASKTFTMKGYEKISKAINPELVFLQSYAADIQVSSFTETLKKWRELVGKKEWEKLFVVVSAQWTLSTENVHQLIIANMMSSERLAAQNIFVTSRPLENIEEARALCGRIVGDRVMATQTFSTGTKRGKENIYSLSTSRDLISKAAEESIDKLKGLCPHLNSKL